MLVVSVPDADSGSPLQGVPQMEAQQIILWAEVLKESERKKSRWDPGPPLANGRYSQSVLDFLSTTSAGRLDLVEEDVPGAGRREEGGGGGTGCPGGGPLFLPTPSFMASTVHRGGREGGGGATFTFLLSLVPDHDFHLTSLCSESPSFVISLVRTISSDRPGRRAKGSLQRAASRGRRAGTWVRSAPP